MKKFLKIILVILILASLLVVLTGCSDTENYSIQDKNLAELEYIETNIISILNKYINNEYFDEDEGVQKWDDIMKDAEKIEGTLATTMTDLAVLNIEAGEISKLSTEVNSLVTAIENKDETNLIVQLNNIYALIPNYLSKYSKDSEKIFKKQLKYYAISTYVAFKMGNIDLAKSQIAEAETRYSEKMQDVNYVKNNEYNINKIYILIQELKGAVDANSLELVRTKYMLLIEEVS